MKNDEQATDDGRDREAAVVVERVVASPRGLATREDRERPTVMNAYGAGRRARPARPRGGVGLEADEDVAGVRDRRVREHALHVGLHDGADAADDEREDARGATAGRQSARYSGNATPKTRSSAAKPAPSWPTP
jgi:hypothetical protein